MNNSKLTLGGSAGTSEEAQVGTSGHTENHNTGNDLTQLMKDIETIRVLTVSIKDIGIKEKLDVLTNEQKVITNRVINALEQYNKDIQGLSAKVEAADKSRDSLIADMNRVLNNVSEALEEVKNVNDQRLTEMVEIAETELNVATDGITKVTEIMTGLLTRFSEIKTPSIKERVKQYAFQVIITLGIICVPLGIVKLIEWLV